MTSATHTSDLWRFNTKRFSVILDCDWEIDPDLSWDETGEIRDKVLDGLWDCVCFRVRVLFEGEEIAADYLGNSIYGDVRDFRKEHIGIALRNRLSGTNYGCYFPGMVRGAISEARQKLRRRAATLPYIRNNETGLAA